MNLFGPQRVGPCHLRRLPAKGAGTVDFAGFRCNPDVGGTLIALDELYGETRGGGKELRIIGSAGVGTNRIEFDLRFGFVLFLCRLYAVAFGQDVHERI